MYQFIFPQEELSPNEIERGLRFLIWDGVFAQVMLVLSTGAFLIGYALMLGANNTIIGLLSAIGPFLQTIQLPSIYFIERVRMRKAIVIVFFTLSRIMLLCIALIPFLPLGSKLKLVSFLVCLMGHHGFAAVGGCAFNSWIRDFIPVERLERFFAHRLTAATMAGALLSFIGGITIDLIKNSSLAQALPISYGVVFVCAGCSGLTSVLSMLFIPEPVMPKTKSISLLPLLREPLEDKNFKNLLIFLGTWNFAVNFAAPFFAVYLLDRLGLSMTWILILSVASQLANVVSFGFWGQLAERFSNKSVLVFCVPIFFLTFLFWPFTTMPQPHLFTLPILIVIHIVGGLAAAGIGLCVNNLALKSAPYGKGAAYLAVNALISGLAATIAPILAGLAADGFNQYETRFVLTVLSTETAETLMEFPTLDLKGIDFLFVIAFIFGLYSVHRLLAIRETGEVGEKVLRDAVLAEAKRTIRQVSTVAGVRHLVTLTYTPLQVLARRLSQSE